MNAQITEEQDKMIFDYIYCTYLINVLEKDLQLIPTIGFKLHEPYINLVEKTIRKLRVELKQLRIEMKKHEMKVENPFISNVDFWHYDYFVGRKQGHKRMLKYHLRNEAERRLDKYF